MKKQITIQVVVKDCTELANLLVKVEQSMVRQYYGRITSYSRKMTFFRMHFLGDCYSVLGKICCVLSIGTCTQTKAEFNWSVKKPVCFIFTMRWKPPVSRPFFDKFIKKGSYKTCRSIDRVLTLGFPFF